MTNNLAELDVEEPYKRVGVIAAPAESDSWTAPAPRAAVASRLDPGQERLLTALEHLFPVRFEHANSAALHSFDGLLVLGPAPLANARAALPQLALPYNAPGRDSCVQKSGADVSVTSSESAPVFLADEPSIARSLRGRAIQESAVACEVPLVPAGGNALAHVGDKTVWWQIDATGALGVSAYPLAGLRGDEALRDHLRPGRFMGLLPLMHFLDQLLGAGGWKLPPPRASFVIDDPNLHRPSYGFLNYAELATHAERHGYHVALATVPLDGWLAGRRATSLLASNATVLSLLMHGNDHVADELGRLRTDAEALSAIAQALRRIDALERRSRVTVDRVMTPPHGVCSEAALRAMFRLGIEAVSVAPPYPWRVGLPAVTPFTEWHPAELVAGGLPVLPRYQLHAPREELAFRAMLGQPLILYGHHDDFAQGLDILAQAASEIDSLGDVQWGSLGWIARGSYATRRLGETLLVRMHARRIVLGVPPGVRALRILIQEPPGGAAGHLLTYAGGCVGVAFEDGLGASEPLKVDAHTRIDLTLMADRPLSPAEVPPPGIRPWPWIRRALVEGHDRFQALR
jgi:hypothetical protein